VDLYKAQRQLADATLARDEAAQRITPGAVSALQIDQDRAARAQADAQVNAAAASLDLVRQNLDFCRVFSPIDGQVSRYYLTLGNLVTQDQTLLTTVVSLDPMYAYCDVDSPTVLRVKRAINEGRMKPYAAGQIPIFMGLQGEEGFPHKGKIDFVNNQENPTTGSILVRGIFDNPLPPKGRRLLTPGMYVRIRLPIGQPHPALLIIDRAILSDQDLKSVYVLDGQNKVQSRRVTTGPLESDGLRQITDGLHADDRVVVGALQQVRPDMEVQPEPIPMLSLVEGREKKSGEAGAGATGTLHPGSAAAKATGTATAALSVLGADVDTAESSLTYTWSGTTLPDGAAPPTFSVNGSNAAKNTTATLSKAGTYGFTVTIAPQTTGTGGSLSVTSSASLAVPQTLKTIAVNPATATVNPAAKQQFTATGFDQFGEALAAQPKFAWTTTVGTITEEGVFTAQNLSGKGTVTAGYPLAGAPGTPGGGEITGASSVTVTNHAPTVAKPASAVLKP
jgi:multidrug efflux system membrane fusion protein